MLTTPYHLSVFNTVYVMQYVLSWKLNKIDSASTVQSAVVLPVHNDTSSLVEVVHRLFYGPMMIFKR